MILILPYTLFYKFSRAVTVEDMGETKDVILDLMEQSGCDIVLKVYYLFVCNVEMSQFYHCAALSVKIKPFSQIENKESISEALCTYDALQKRMPFLDQLMEGLQEFKLTSAMKVFPDVFEPLFVGTDKCDPQDVINILHPKTLMTDSEQCVYQHLQRFLMGCNQSGEVFFCDYNNYHWRLRVPFAMLSHGPASNPCSRPS